MARRFENYRYDRSAAGHDTSHMEDPQHRAICLSDLLMELWHRTQRFVWPQYDIYQSGIREKNP
nr:MAG TPA: alpha-S2-casein peptide [Caudoviricetes sp.]